MLWGFGFAASILILTWPYPQRSADVFRVRFPLRVPVVFAPAASGRVGRWGVIPAASRLLLVDFFFGLDFDFFFAFWALPLPSCGE